MSVFEHDIEALDNAWRKLRKQWIDTETLWQDNVKREFEIKYWNEFERIIPIFQKTLQSTDELVTKANKALGIGRL
jgi:hypothetical protein